MKLAAIETDTNLAPLKATQRRADTLIILLDTFRFSCPSSDRNTNRDFRFLRAATYTIVQSLSDRDPFEEGEKIHFQLDPSKYRIVVSSE